MIPKVIHYCWFGGKALPRSVKKCIRTWKKMCPDYVIKEWNESNFDLDFCPYVREAYDHKFYAFVSDVVRLYALYYEGGIYMDIDVELKKPLDSFLYHVGFCGYESRNELGTAILASEKGMTWVKDNLEVYLHSQFILPDGRKNLLTNVKRLTKYFMAYGLRADNTHQDITHEMTVYPKTVFCPLCWDNKPSQFSDKTVAIHHFEGSWLPEDERLRLKYPKWYTWIYYFYWLPKYEFKTKILRQDVKRK